MIYIKGQDRVPIEMIRGDSEVFEIGIVINGIEYTPQEGDKIRFAMRHNILDTWQTKWQGQTVLRKEIPIDTMQLHIDPEDTKHLPFGRYVYDMQITFAEDGKVKTFIKPSPFKLLKEVD